LNIDWYVINSIFGKNNKAMKKLFRLGLLVVFAMTMNSCGYNGMVSGREAVTAQWSNVENEYQRRANLVDNLVETVKAAGKYEQETLEKIIQARASATQTKIDPTNLSQEDIDEYNTSIQTFPNVITARMFGFQPKGYFKAEAGAEKATKIKL
jgi:LemA protein